MRHGFPLWASDKATPRVSGTLFSILHETRSQSSAHRRISIVDRFQLLDRSILLMDRRIA
jgi:hypothetical protein